MPMRVTLPVLILLFSALLVRYTHAFTFTGTRVIRRVRQSVITLAASPNDNEKKNWFADQVIRAKQERLFDSNRQQAGDADAFSSQEDMRGMRQREGTSSRQSSFSRQSYNQQVQYNQQVRQQQLDIETNRRDSRFGAITILSEQEQEAQQVYEQKQRQYQQEFYNHRDTQRQRTRAAASEKSVSTSIKSAITNFKCFLVGAVVGPWAVLPVTACHYLFFSDYSYTTNAQWQYDVIASSLEAGMFAIAYRTMLKQDVQDANPISPFVLALVVLRSAVRVEVPTECAAGDGVLELYCTDFQFFPFVSKGMTAEFFINSAESLTLFVATAIAMNWFLYKDYIRRYPE